MKFPVFGLPLLSKELAEQAARPRTYIIRVAYAAFLYSVGFIVYLRMIAVAGGSALNLLGSGGEFYNRLVAIQFLGIYLFMPALACGAIASEKEKNSLVLLVLTRLGPTTILVEKFLGRVIPMLMFLVLCLPLLTIAYSMGGLTQEYLWTGVFLLVVTVFQVASLAILCSAYCRTTVAAFIACYLVGAIYVSGPILFPMVTDVLLTGSWDWGDSTGDSGSIWNRYMFFPAALLSRADTQPFASTLWQCLPSIISPLLFIAAARWVFLRRAFLDSRNVVLIWFRRLDAFFRQLNNNRLTRGIVLVPESAELPLFAPLAWRETNKSALGAFRYLVRLFVATEFPVTICCVLTALVDVREAVAVYLSVILGLVWPMAVLIVSVKAANLINSERTRQTLDVLLTTPMSGRTLIQEKMHGVWRLCLVVAVPLLTIMVFKTWWITGTQFRDLHFVRKSMESRYLLCSVLTLLIYLPSIAWISAWFGLWIRHQTRAIFTALAVIIVWCVVPLFVLSAIGGTAAALMSPVTIVILNETLRIEVIHEYVLLVIAINFVLHGGILWLFRWLTLRHVDYHLGRLGTDVDTSVQVQRMKRLVT